MTTREKSFIHELEKLLERYGVEIKSIPEDQPYEAFLMFIGRDIELLVERFAEDD